MVKLKKNHFLTSLITMGLTFLCSPNIVLGSCEFTSADSTTFYIGERNSFSVTATRSTENIKISGDALPERVYFERAGISFLYGVPEPGTEGTYKIIFKTRPKSVGIAEPYCTQNFTLTVIERAQPPEVVSAEQQQSDTSMIIRAKNQNGLRYKNIIKFKPPKEGPTPVVFRIYKDKKMQHLAGEVPNTEKKRYRFVRRNVKACSNFHYYLVSVGENGIESRAVKASLKNSKEHCPKKINKKKPCQ